MKTHFKRYGYCRHPMGAMRILVGGAVWCHACGSLKMPGGDSFENPSCVNYLPKAKRPRLKRRRRVHTLAGRPGGWRIVSAEELYRAIGELLKRNPDARNHEVRLDFEHYREEVDMVSGVHIRCEGVGQDINRVILVLRDGDQP